MLAVVLGSEPFTMAETRKETGILEIAQIGYDEFDKPLTPTRFSVVDMDRDEKKDVVLELTDGLMGWLLILHYQDGNVYGYRYDYRGLQNISTSGVAMGSSGASGSGLFRIHFDGPNIIEEPISEEEADAIFDGWHDVTWYDYTAADVEMVITSGT